MNARLMTHLVAGYPTGEASYQAALGMARGGAAFLEIQFPFSDPSADGPAIQEACQAALEGAWKTRDGWELVRRIAHEAPKTPVYIMAYASLVVTPGVQHFCAKAKENGAYGLIVPDLAPGHDEGLGESARAVGLEVLPVVVPSVSPSRLDAILKEGYRRLYVALRSGITGMHTQISPALQAFLEDLLQRGVETFGGFGIDSREQVEKLSPHVFACVVGSHLVRVLKAVGDPAAPEAYENAAQRAVQELLGAPLGSSHA